MSFYRDLNGQEWDTDWGKYLSDSGSTSSGEHATRKVVGFFSYELGFEAMKLVYSLQESLNFRLVGIVTDNLISGKAKISKAKRSWKYFDQAQQVSQQLKIENFALLHGIPVYTGSVKSEVFKDAILKEWQPDLILMYGFGQLVPIEVFQFPRLGMYNVHPSNLDKNEYSGPDPFGEMTRDGKTSTVITLHALNGEFDQGPTILKSDSVPIGNPSDEGYFSISDWFQKIIPDSNRLIDQFLRQIFER